MAQNTSGLRPWKPGQSGNPGGRTKGIPALIRECGDPRELVERAFDILRGRTITVGDKVRTREGELIQGAVSRTVTPELADIRWALQFLADRLWGTATQRVEMTTHDDSPITDADWAEIRRMLAERDRSAEPATPPTEH